MRLSVVGKAHEAGAGEAGFGWFIYGSSLDADAFAAWAKEHGYTPPDLATGKPARLADYALSFEVMSRFWGGAVASLQPQSGAFVEGLLLPMPKEAKGLVEHKEGVISGLFEGLRVRVTPLAGGAAEDAWAFVAAPDRRLPKPAEPARRFVETVLAGGRKVGLSQPYLDTLAALIR